MLPEKFIKPRFRKNKVYPSFLSETVEHLEGIESMIDVFRQGKGEKKKILEETLAEYHSLFSPQILLGVSKLLVDRGAFVAPVVGDLADLRESAFDLSRQIWGGMHEDEGLEKHRREILSLLPEKTKVDIKNLEIKDWLYGDLPANYILLNFKDLNAQELLKLYNRAQIQGILFHARFLRLKVFDFSRSLLKKLLLRLKFLGLMFEIKSQKNNTLLLEVFGANAILENSRSYGLEFSRFFLIILSLPQWKIQAEIEYKKRGNSYMLELDESCPCRVSPEPPHFPEQEEVLELIKTWNAKKENIWQAHACDRIFPLPHNRYLLPHIVLENPVDEKLIYLEMIRYSSPQRLESLRAMAADLPENYFIAVRGKKSNRLEWYKTLPEKTFFFNRKLTSSLLKNHLNFLTKNKKMN